MKELFFKLLNIPLTAANSNSYYWDFSDYIVRVNHFFEDKQYQIYFTDKFSHMITPPSDQILNLSEKEYYEATVKLLELADSWIQEKYNEISEIIDCKLRNQKNLVPEQKVVEGFDELIGEDN